MINVNIVQWRGNKNVSLLRTAMTAVPRIEDYMEFQAEGKKVRGKVTRVTHKFTTDATGDQIIDETEVRVNTRT
jgi:hypothetical protein